MINNQGDEVMKKPIRVGIGGLGRSGYGIHSEYLKDDPDFQVVAAASAAICTMCCATAGSVKSSFRKSVARFL